jgi:alpha-amylase
MPTIALYLKTHQPYRIKDYRAFAVGKDHHYFNGEKGSKTNNEEILKKICEKSYKPTNAILLNLLNTYPDFRCSISLSGTLLEQLETHEPDTLATFQAIIATGRVEVLGETYYHSLSFYYSLTEFEAQVDLHKKIIKRLFNVTPKVFSNTELAYRDDLAHWADKHKYTGIIAEGWDPILGWRSPNFVYTPPNVKKIKLLLKNYRLSDDIAFRFSNKSWQGWPLTVEKFASWVNQSHGNGETINLFMDYETFGEHQWADTGIFEFLKHLPHEIYKHKDNGFLTVSETCKQYSSKDTVSMPSIVTWADTERDLSAWTGNMMQQSSLTELYRIEEHIRSTKNKKLIDDWRKLQTSDHVYYMCTKWFSDGDVHKYFSPYESPYEAYIAFTNALTDLKLRAGIL